MYDGQTKAGGFILVEDSGNASEKWDMRTHVSTNAYAGTHT